jgi:hypothetical protein
MLMKDGLNNLLNQKIKSIRDISNEEMFQHHNNDN